MTYSMYRYHDGVIPRSGDSTRTDIHIHIHVYEIRKDEHIIHERIYYEIQTHKDENKYQILYTIRNDEHDIMYKMHKMIYGIQIRVYNEEIRNDAQQKPNLFTDEIAKLIQNDLYDKADIDLHDVIQNNLYNDECRSDIGVDEILHDKKMLEWIANVDQKIAFVIDGQTTLKVNATKNNWIDYADSMKTTKLKDEVNCLEF